VFSSLQFVPSQLLLPAENPLFAKQSHLTVAADVLHPGEVGDDIMRIREREWEAIAMKVILPSDARPSS
jgi:hypothetical protein